MRRPRRFERAEHEGLSRAASVIRRQPAKRSGIEQRGGCDRTSLISAIIETTGPDLDALPNHELGGRSGVEDVTAGAGILRRGGTHDVQTRRGKLLRHR